MIGGQTTAPIRAHLVNPGDPIAYPDGGMYRVHLASALVLGKHHHRALSIVSYRRSTLRLVTGGL